MRSEEKEIKVLKKVYIANDGKEFNTETECLDYEESIKIPSVNEMLWAALFTPSRKRKCEYQAELEALGYKIYKDRCWDISLGDNWVRKCYDEDFIRSNKKMIINYGYYYKPGHYGHGKRYVSGHHVNVPKEKINLEGILNATPTYSEPYYHRYGKEVSKNVYYLRNAIWSRNNAKNALDNAESEKSSSIEKARIKYEEAISEANRHYDWVLESYGKDYKAANEVINKLLKRS